jgi:hypothetical protein
VDIVIEQFNIIDGQYNSARAIATVFVENDDDVQSGHETMKRLTRARIRYNVMVDVVNSLFVHHNEALKKERALDKEIVEKVKKEYETNGPQKTSEEEDSEKSE